MFAFAVKDDMPTVQKITESVNYIKSRVKAFPTLAIVLGSGLGAFVDELEGTMGIAYQDIPYFPVPTVTGHQGRMVFGRIKGVDLLVLQGRVHFYEGYTMPEVVYPIRVLAELGVKSLIITNAAGGLNPYFSPGDLMVIVDHINFNFRNPLIGVYHTEMGPRFCDRSHAYYGPYIELAERVALDLGIKVWQGVLVGCLGPNYETAAEVRMLRLLGADAATMSTVPEVLVAHHQGMKVLGISFITNLATGLTTNRLSHEEVIRTTERALDKFVRLVKQCVPRIHQE